MMDPFTYDYPTVARHLRELRAQAEQDRLARRASRTRPGQEPRRWRRWASALLITSGAALIGHGHPVAETGPQGCVDSRCDC